MIVELLSLGISRGPQVTALLGSLGYSQDDSYGVSGVQSTGTQVARATERARGRGVAPPCRGCQATAADDKDASCPAVLWRGSASCAARP